MTHFAEFTSRIQKKEEKILKEGTQGTNTPNLKAKFFVQSIARPLAMTWQCALSEEHWTYGMGHWDNGMYWAKKCKKSVCVSLQRGYIYAYCYC